tara:strand:+ start:718 stop:915 length:198 start_codon:yes stop_codon:yes gene_type:complete
MTKEEIQIELSEVVKFNSVSGDKITRIYNLNRLIFNDNRNYCNKCPSVIRNVFNKLKKYHKNNKC